MLHKCFDETNIFNNTCVPLKRGTIEEINVPKIDVPIFKKQICHSSHNTSVDSFGVGEFHNILL